MTYRMFFLIALLNVIPIPAVSEAFLVERQKAEIDAFDSVWQGGFFVGDPLKKHFHDPAQLHVHEVLFNGETMSCMHATYLSCIKPYVSPDTTVLEIGPGRGAWTRCFTACKAKFIYCVDAKSAEDNDFWRYVGDHDNILYHKVNDFSLDCVPDDSIDLVFSALVFCHISPLMINEYLKNMHKKMKKGAHAFIMYADYDKYNQHYARLRNPQRRSKESFEEVYLSTQSVKARWYHLGIPQMGEMLKKIGYRIVNLDLNVDYRDPVVHFIKP